MSDRIGERNVDDRRVPGEVVGDAVARQGGGRPFWLRALMVLLAVPNLITGGWAVISPRSWFDSFPGWAPELIAAHPPFNDHLAFDAGAGLLASGLVMTLALVWPRAEVAVTAAVGYTAFALPHAVWHLANPSELMSSVDNAVNTGSLVAAVAGSAVVLFWHTRDGRLGASQGLQHNQKARTVPEVVILEGEQR